MKKIVLLCVSVLLIVTMAGSAAVASLPCDADNNGQLTNDEVSSAALSYMMGDSNVKLDDVRDAAHVLTYWEGKAYSFVDRRGNSVTINRPVKRIVDIEGAYGVMTLIAIGAEDRLIGINDEVKKHTEFPESVRNLPSVGASYTPDTEKILSLNPDLLHGYTIYDLTVQKKALEPLGVPVAQFDCYIPENYTVDMRDIGKIVGEEENASKLLEFNEYYINLIEDRVKGLNESQKPTVYVEMTSDYKTGDRNINWIDQCGGVNAFPEIKGTASVSDEELIKRNPQVIIKIVYQSPNSVNDSGYGATGDAEMNAYLEKLKSRPGWDQIDAVKNGRVYLIHSEAKSYLAVNTLYFAKAIHPELFKDVSGDDVLKEWYSRFLRQEFTGILTYPVPA